LAVLEIRGPEGTFEVVEGRADGGSSAADGRDHVSAAGVADVVEFHFEAADGAFEAAQGVLNSSLVDDARVRFRFAADHKAGCSRQEEYKAASVHRPS
jgi:hypothetical protein